MAHKRKFAKYIFEFVMISLSAFKVIPNLVHLVEKEASIVGKNFASLIILYLIALVFLASIWVCLLVTLFFYLVSLQISSISAMLIVLGLNIISLLITYTFILRRKNKVSFAKTKEIFHSLKR